MNNIQVRLVRFYDDEAVGALEINGDGYEYIPTPAPELRPDETSKVLIQRVTDDGRKVGDCYWVASYFDGRCSCTCPDWLFRKAKGWKDCKHTTACKDFGLIREPEPEPVGMVAPW